MKLLVKMLEFIVACGFLIGGACVGGYFLYIFFCKKKRTVTTPGVVIAPPGETEQNSDKIDRQ